PPGGHRRRGAGGAGVIRDTWRAVLVLVVGTLLLEAAGFRRQPPNVATQCQSPPAATPTASWPAAGGGWAAAQPWPPAAHQPAWTPQPQIIVAREATRPLHRVGGAVVELAESVLGVIR
ncbi:MAG: hypothetical protein EBZ49_18195, partial [Proteobacteria bacterium]|nr:hypothetical protein [Pseudomonadota bacterium]